MTYDCSSTTEKRTTRGRPVPVDELVAGLTAYREVVLGALHDGHELDGRWWAQKNPAE
jgi:hypothetical protein